MTTLPATPIPISTPRQVYPAQQDSHLLIGAMLRGGLPFGRRVADLCTGSGVVAIAAAEAGAKSVVAVDISAEAVQCAKMNAIFRGTRVIAERSEGAEGSERPPKRRMTSSPALHEVGGQSVLDQLESLDAEHHVRLEVRCGGHQLADHVVAHNLFVHGVRFDMLVIERNTGCGRIKPAQRCGESLRSG